MLIYLAKMALLLPLLGLLIWGSLKLTKRMQSQLSKNTGGVRRIRLVESCFLGPGMRVAVIQFHGREILLGSTKNGITRLSEAPMHVENDQ